MTPATSLMTVSEVRDAVESGGSDAILQTYRDAAAADILRYAGPHGTAQTYSKPIQPIRISYLLLPRRAESVQSVTINGVALDADDYELEHGGLSVRVWFDRPYTWTTDRYARYQWTVEVQYTAVDDDAQRKRALIQLVRLDVQHDGLASERVGDYSRASADYAKERKRILGALRSPSARIA